MSYTRLAPKVIKSIPTRLHSMRTYEVTALCESHGQ